MADGTRIGTGYVTVVPDFGGFQEKVAKKLNESLGPAMDKAGANANKRLSKSLGNNSSLRSSFAPLVKRFQKVGDEAGEEIAKHIGKGAKRAEGDMFGLSGAIKAMEKNSSSASSRAKVLANDTFGIAKAAQDAGHGYKLLSNTTRGWSHDAKAADSVGRRLSKGVTSLFSDLGEVGRNLKAAAGGFGNFEGTMARANRGFQFFRNILGSLKVPGLVAGVALLAQSLSALAAGAVAVTSALGPLSGALIALPALALAGAQAVGVLKLAMSGIGDAVKAGLTAQIKGGEQATQTMRTQENAAEALADAHRTLASSERDAEYATEDLTKARKEATRQLQDMQIAARESNLTEREGAQALREARRELNKTLREPTSTGLDIRGAEQQVEQAKFSLEETKLDAKRARSDYSEANKKGVEGSPEVVSAKRAQEDAARSVADAERGVAKAVRENTDAMAQQGSAATALDQKLAALTPTGRKFAKFLISLKPQFDQLRETASKGLFPGAETGIKSAMKNFGVFKGIVGETSGALGNLAEKAGKKLGSEAWGRDLGKIGASNTKVIENLGQAGLNLGDAFRNILVSAEPLIEWMGKGTLKFSEWVKTSAQAGRESGKLGHFFDETREAMEKVWHILKPLGEGLLNIGKAAKPLGDEILDSLGKSAEGFAKWTDSTKGKNQLKNYFVEVKPAIFAIGRLVRDATDDFANMGKQKGVSSLIESIRTKLLPLLSGGANGITGLLGGFIDKFDDLRKEGVPTFDAFVQVLAEHAAEGAIKIANALVRGFLNSSPLGKLAIGGWLLTKFGGLSAFTKLGKYVGGQFGVGVESGAATTSAGGGAITKSLGGKLKSGFISLGKQLGYAMVAYGLFNGTYTALTESKAAHGLTDNLHNFAVGVFKGFGLSIGESTAEEFAKGFKQEIETFASAGVLGQQSIITPKIEERATGLAEQQVPAGEGAPGFEEAYERAISNIMKDVSSRRASAKEIFSNFWEDMGPDEKTFARQLRSALVQGDKLLARTGIKLPKVSLETNPAQTAKATKELLGKFDYLRKGIGNNLHDINKVSKEAGERIAQTFGKGTKEGRELTARNMKLTADAIGTQMARSGDITKKGVDRIKELIRNANLLAPTRKMAAEFGEEWSKRIGTTKKATNKAVEDIITEARKMPLPMRKIALETWLEQAAQAKKSGKLSVEAFREMRSKLFSEFGVFHKGSKDFNKKVAEGFVGMVNNSGGAMGILMQNLSGLLGKLGDKKKLNWKIIDAHVSKDPNGASLGRQRGGPVPARAAGGLASVVPGTSTGDRHVLALGGRPVAKVESGEGIFVGNRKMMAAAKQANDAVPRFQNGGFVGSAQQLKRGGLIEPKLEGQAGPLKRLGQAAIGKVFEGAKSFLDKNSAPEGGAGGTIADAGPLRQFNHTYPSHMLSEVSGKTRFPESLVARIAGWAGLPGRTFGQIAHGESDFYPGVYGIDPGGTIGRGLWQITSGVGNDAMIAKYGGPQAMFNPLINAEVAKQIYDSSGIGAWYGTKFVTGMQDGGLLKLAAGGALQPAAHPRGFDPEGRKSKFAALLGRSTGALQGTAARAVAWFRNNLGTQQGSAKQERWGPDPWCGYAFGADMSAQGVPLPPNPGYTGSYEDEWGSGSDPVSGLGSALGGDFLGFNGEHTAMYIGGGQMISGNWGDEVAQDSVSAESEPLTSVRRPHYPGGSGAPGSTTTTGGEAVTGPKKKPAEKVPQTYGGVSTRPVQFGHPKTLSATEDEINKLVGSDGKGGLAKKYRRAGNKAEKEGKHATASVLRKRLQSIEQRVIGLRRQQHKLRIAEATKALKKGIKGKLGKIEGYEQRIEGSQRLYEEAAQFAEQIVGLEPESPEIAAEPEFPEQAKGESDKVYEKKRRDAHNAYETSREGQEKTYVSGYDGYIEGQEKPAYQSVLEKVADWRNNILRAETFGYGKGEPSVDGIERGFEKQDRGVINRIDFINTFSQKVGERVSEYWAKVKEEVSQYRQAHPGEGLSKHLEEEKDGLPGWLKRQVEERETLREGLPALRSNKTQLEEAIGTAREAFFAGGENRLVPPRLPLPGSGSLEEGLADVQGLHAFPEQHGILGADAFAGAPQAGRFGGVIWGVQESIKGLGLKIKQAGSSIQKASIEGEGTGAGGEESQSNTEREQLLEELLEKANQRLAVKGALEPVINQFEASYPLPFAGTFHAGGTIAGPSSQEYMAKVRGAEHVLTPEQMSALAPAGGDSGPSGAPISIEQLNLHHDGTATARYQGREFTVAVEDVVHKTPRPLVGSGAGRAFRP